MALSGAQRQARARAHRKGDHSLCDPSRRDCDATVTPPVTHKASGPPGLGQRGRRLWREMDGEGRVGGERALVEEACRIADRLDRLDGILSGDPGEWMRFRVSEDGTEVTVTIDKTLAEARQQAAVLKQIVSELRQGGRAQAEPRQEASRRDELAKRREDRRRAAGL